MQGASVRPCAQGESLVTCADSLARQNIPALHNYFLLPIIGTLRLAARGSAHPRLTLFQRDGTIFGVASAFQPAKDHQFQAHSSRRQHGYGSRTTCL